MKKFMRKMLAGMLAATVAMSCVLPAYAEENSWGTGHNPSAGTDRPGTAADGTEMNMSTKADGTATLGQVEKTTRKSVTISPKVTVNGVKYTITKISADAFAECTKMKDVTLPATIKTIAKNAFNGAKKLKSAEVKGKPVVKKAAFAGAKNLKTMTFTGGATFEASSFKGTKLTKLNVSKKATFKKNAFKGADTKNCTVRASGKMSNKKFNKFVKMLRDAGFKGKIKKA